MTPRGRVAIRAEKLGDYRMFPGMQIWLTSARCRWDKSDSAATVIDRLGTLRGGSSGRRRVGWPGPGCGRLKRRSHLSSPSGMDDREIKRLANPYRS